MENNKLNLLWLYPDMLNLHGDRGNVQAFENVAKKLGIEINVERLEDYDATIDFEKTDVILVNPGELKVIKKVIEKFQDKKEAIEAYINQNKNIILIGTSGAIMAKETERLDGSKITGLGFLDMSCKEREYINGDDIYFELNDEKTEIVGSQIQVIDTQLHKDIALGTIKYGLGNNGNGTEGAKYKNVIFTNCLGPVFVKNPWWAEKIIKEAMKAKGFEIGKNIDETEYELELNSNKAIKEFINSKLKEK